MDYKLNEMCQWERQKAMFLINVAENELKMNLEGYGEVSVNQNSGYTYLWVEDYPFTLYMPIDCNLNLNDVYVLWTNSDNGEEIEMVLGNETLEDVNKFVERCDKGLITA